MSLWPLAVYFIVVVLLVAAMLYSSYLLGPRHNDRATGSPYEGGILSAGSAQVRLSAKFYLFAMFFVIFDLEAAFLFAWAIAGREAGWAGFIEVAVFIGVLGVALVYLWRVGALDWQATRVRPPEAGRPAIATARAADPPSIGRASGTVAAERAGSGRDAG